MSFNTTTELTCLVLYPDYIWCQSSMSKHHKPTNESEAALGRLRMSVPTNVQFYMLKCFWFFDRSGQQWHILTSPSFPGAGAQIYLEIICTFIAEPYNLLFCWARHTVIPCAPISNLRLYITNELNYRTNAVRSHFSKILFSLTIIAYTDGISLIHY